MTPPDEFFDVLAVGPDKALRERMVRCVDRSAARLRRLVPLRLPPSCGHTGVSATPLTDEWDAPPSTRCAITAHRSHRQALGGSADARRVTPADPCRTPSWRRAAVAHGGTVWAAAGPAP